MLVVRQNWCDGIFCDNSEAQVAFINMVIVDVTFGFDWMSPTLDYTKFNSSVAVFLEALPDLKTHYSFAKMLNWCQMPQSVRRVRFLFNSLDNDLLFQHFFKVQNLGEISEARVEWQSRTYKEASGSSGTCTITCPFMKPGSMSLSGLTEQQRQHCGERLDI